MQRDLCKVTAPKKRGNEQTRNCMHCAHSWRQCSANGSKSFIRRIACRPVNDAQSEASSASAASWAPAPRSRYMEAATPAKPMPAEGKGSAANRGLVWLLQEGPRFVVAGAVVAAVATGFVKVPSGLHHW